jgi:lysine-N-methylase
MKVYFPSYYKDFACKAGECSHSCCIGWEIGVDAETLAKYQTLGDAEILSHIESGCIATAEDGRCPFLQSDGLCRLICRFGDGYISEICREHPRFYHRVGDRVEMSIGASCEEAARLILSSDFTCFGSAEMEINLDCDTQFDALSHRDEIYRLLSDRTLTLGERLDGICSKYEINCQSIRVDREITDTLEMLDEGDRELIFAERVGENTTNQVYAERFFAYLLFRHLSVARDFDDLRARLCFCIYLTELFLNMTANATDFCAICEAVRIISEEIEYSEDNTDTLIFEFTLSI